MPADNWVLSLVMWLAGSELVRVAAHRRPLLAKVVAGVVERMGVSVSRWAHVCRSDLSGWPSVCSRGVFAGSTVLDGRVLSTRWWRGGVSDWVRGGGSVGGPACSFGQRGRLLRCGGSLAAAMYRGRSALGNTSASCPSSR
jgi:hypothetical protein